MDAIALLKADHRKVKKLLAELETTTNAASRPASELFATIKGELTSTRSSRRRSSTPSSRPIRRRRTSCSRHMRSTTSSTC